MKVCSVAFLLCLALMHLAVADILAEDNENPDIANLLPPEVYKEIPDGIIYLKGDELADNKIFLHFTDVMLEEFSMLMLNCTTKECRKFVQCNKYGDQVICLSLSLFDLDDFLSFSNNGEPFHPEDDIGIDDAGEEIEDMKNEEEDNQDEKVEGA